MNYQYRVGGSLAYNHPTYVERKADRELLAALKTGKFCYVFNCRQMGKSSLRVRTMHQLQAQGMCCASVDITSLGSDDNLQQWYNGLITQLFLGFNLTGKINLKAWLREREELPAVQKLNQFIEEVLLVKFPDRKILIFIDEIDKIISLKFSLDDFFSLIRFFYNQRADNPNYERITFALFGVATPADLIREKTQTSFNIGQAIELTGFTLDEVQPLEMGLEKIAENPQAVLKEVLAWTGGQPFLTQKICQLIVGQGYFINSEQEKQIVQKIIDLKIIDNWESQDEPVHLKTIRDRLLRNERKASRLLGLYQQILNQDFIEADDSPEQTELRLSGLVVKRQGKLRTYNSIYGAIFDRKWIDRQLKKLRPYSESIQAWEASSLQDESRLLRGRALQDALAWAVGKSLSNLDYQFLNASQIIDKREAEINLETERKANKILADANYKATRRIRIGSIFLIVSLLGAFIATKQAWDRDREAEIGRRLQRVGDTAWQQFQYEQIEALTSAIQAGQELNHLVKDGRGLQDYPATSPLLSLQQILENIREKNQLESHTEAIYNISYSPKGNFLATASGDGTVKLWNDRGKEILTLKGHQGAVYGVSFSPDGQKLATASQDKTVKLWNIQGKELATFRGHKESVYSVSFSPDGRYIASTSRDKTAILWMQGQPLALFKGHTKSVDDISFSPNGKTLATASRDGTIRLWNLQGQSLKILGQNKTNAYYSVSFSSDGRYIATATADRTAQVWDLQGKPIVTLEGHQDFVNNVNFSSSRQWIVTASSDGTAKLWNLQGKELATLKGHQNVVFDAVFSPDGQRIVTASSDTTAKIWDISQILTLKANPLERGIVGVSFAPDRTKIAIAGKNNQIYLYNFQGNLIREFSTDLASIDSISFSPDSQQIAVAAAQRNNEQLVRVIKLWNLQGEIVTQVEVDTVPLYSIAFSQDGHYLATGSRDGIIKLWNLQTKIPQLVQQFQAYNTQISNLVWVDGQQLVIASKEGELGLWDIAGHLKTPFTGHQDIIYQIRLSPDGGQIATASRDGTAKLWNLQGNLLVTLQWDFFPVYSVNFSPDSQQVITASSDGTARRWDNQGNLLAEFKGYQDAVYGVVFSDDGRQVITVAPDRLRVWQVEGEVRLEALLQQGCQWLEDYLNTHPKEKNKLTGCF